MFAETQTPVKLSAALLLIALAFLFQNCRPEQNAPSSKAPLKVSWELEKNVPLQNYSVYEVTLPFTSNGCTPLWGNWARCWHQAPRPLAEIDASLAGRPPPKRYHLQKRRFPRPGNPS